MLDLTAGLIASEMAIETGLAFAIVNFTKCNLAFNSPEFLPIRY